MTFDIYSLDYIRHLPCSFMRGLRSSTWSLASYSPSKTLTSLPTEGATSTCCLCFFTHSSDPCHNHILPMLQFSRIGKLGNFITPKQQGGVSEVVWRRDRTRGGEGSRKVRGKSSEIQWKMTQSEGWKGASKTNPQTRFDRLRSARVSKWGLQENHFDCAMHARSYERALAKNTQAAGERQGGARSGGVWSGDAEVGEYSRCALASRFTASTPDTCSSDVDSKIPYVRQIVW